MMRILYLLAILIIAMDCQYVCAQNIKPEFSDAEKVQTPSPDRVKLRPVVYEKKTDGIPEKMKVSGIIEEVSIGFFSCGFVHWNGTLKIKLLNNVNGYKHDYVYVATTCFFTHASGEIINKTFEFNLSKLRKGKMPNGTIFNTIDSNGIAFYQIDRIKSLK